MIVTVEIEGVTKCPVLEPVCVSPVGVRIVYPVSPVGLNLVMIILPTRRISAPRFTRWLAQISLASKKHTFQIHTKDNGGLICLQKLSA